MKTTLYASHRGVLNPSLLPAAAALLWSAVRLLRPKTVLRAGERASWT